MAGTRRVLGYANAIFTDEAQYQEGPPRNLEDAAVTPDQALVFPPRGVGRATLTLPDGCIPPAPGKPGDCLSSDATGNFRVFVVLDPEGTIAEETHGWRSQDVAIIPSAGGVNKAIRVNALDDSGETLGTIEVTSQNSFDADARCLRTTATRSATTTSRN